MLIMTVNFSLFCLSFLFAVNRLRAAYQCPDAFVGKRELHFRLIVLAFSLPQPRVGYDVSSNHKHNGCQEIAAWATTPLMQVAQFFPNNPGNPS